MDKVQKEIWKAIPGYEGRYEASNLGRVRSSERWVPHTRKGRVIRKLKIKAQSVGRCGYLSVLLCVNQNKKRISSHRLIALAFIPNPENKREVNHKNGIRSDNRLENLEWVTPTENKNHSLLTGIRSTKIPIGVVRTMRSERGRGVKVNINQLAKKYGVRRNAISNAINGRTFNYL